MKILIAIIAATMSVSAFASPKPQCFCTIKVNGYDIKNERFQLPRDGISACETNFGYSISVEPNGIEPKSGDHLWTLAFNYTHFADEGSGELDEIAVKLPFSEKLKGVTKSDQAGKPMTATVSCR